MARIMSTPITPLNKGVQPLQVQAYDLHKNPTIQVENQRNPIKPKISGKILGFIFYFQLLSVLVLAVILIIRGFISSHARNRFQPLDWYPSMISSVGLAGITGLTWQIITYCNPSKAIKLAFCFSPMVTCAMGVLLITFGSGLGLGIGILSILVSVIQSLYSCWASPRFDHAVSVLSVSSRPPRKTILLTVVATVITVIYSSTLISGVGGARASGTQIDRLFIAIIVVSMIWTLQVIKNFIQVAVSRVRYTSFAGGDESVTDTWTSFREVAGPVVGPVCFGSVLVPTVSLVRGSSRASRIIAGDSDEFLFSCTDCYSGIASRLVKCGNRWGFVHVGVYGKGIIQSSFDTWEMFQRCELEELIDSDLTSSFCFFCGISGGALSALLGGCWTLLIHKEYATEISIFGFLIGYFIGRVAMAWPQACVSAYHVAFAENPQSARFDATIPVDCRSYIETDLAERNKWLVI